MKACYERNKKNYTGPLQSFLWFLCRHLHTPNFHLQEIFFIKIFFFFYEIELGIPDDLIDAKDSKSMSENKKKINFNIQYSKV